MVPKLSIAEEEAKRIRMIFERYLWLEYMSLSGYTELFSEASLIIPVAEYFRGRQWTVVAINKIGPGGAIEPLGACVRAFKTASSGRPQRG